MGSIQRKSPVDHFNQIWLITVLPIDFYKIKSFFSFFSFNHKMAGLSQIFCQTNQHKNMIILVFLQQIVIVPSLAIENFNFSNGNCVNININYFHMKTYSVSMGKFISPSSPIIGNSLKCFQYRRRGLRIPVTLVMGPQVEYRTDTIVVPSLAIVKFNFLMVILLV